MKRVHDRRPVQLGDVENTLPNTLTFTRQRHFHNRTCSVSVCKTNLCLEHNSQKIASIRSNSATHAWWKKMKWFFFSKSKKNKPEGNIRQVLGARLVRWRWRLLCARPAGRRRRVGRTWWRAGVASRMTRAWRRRHALSSPLASRRSQTHQTRRVRNERHCSATDPCYR